MVGRAVILGTGLALLAAAAPVIAQHHPLTQQRPVALVAEYDGIIHPIASEFLTTVIDQADTTGAAVVLFILRTPGGLVDSTRAMVSRMITSRAPVVVYVAPSGARAASAGFILVLAADVAVMAPGTHIGAAHPVSGSGEKMDETMAKKAAEDVAAYARTLASRRHRNVKLAEEAVNNSRAFTDEEARNASPPLVDLVASDIPDLLHMLDGRTVTRFDGTTVVLKTAGARVIPIAMTLRQRILSSIAHPNVAYLLLSLGTLGLTIELWSPGAVLPGVVGGLCLLLAFFAFQILPVNFAGVLLILFGMVLLVLELKVTSYGLLTVGGLASLIFGSMILVDSPLPELQVSLRFALRFVLGSTATSSFLVRLAVASQRLRPVTGVAAMIGEPGHALTAIEPGRGGRVMTHGEIWTAIASEPIAEGARIRVTGVDGLTLTVRNA